MEISLIESMFINLPYFQKHGYQAGEWCSKHDTHTLYQYTCQVYPAMALYLAKRLPSLYSSLDTGYHGVWHGISVAGDASRLMMDFGCNRKGEITAFLAGLFHDAGYVINRPSERNVNMAAEIFRKEASFENPMTKVMKSHSISVKTVQKAILCTQFNLADSTYPVPPTTQVEMALRDADLLTFTSSKWPWMFKGLMLEHGLDPNDWNDCRRALESHYHFLLANKPFTEHDYIKKSRSDYLGTLCMLLMDI